MTGRVARVFPTSKYHGKLNGLSFTVSNLWVEPTEEVRHGRRVHRLVKDFLVTMSFDGGYVELLVPAGFTTDFASVPRVVEIVIGRRDSIGLQECSVIHDLACVRGIPRGVANAIMLAALVCFGVPMWRRALIFIGLSLFGYRTPLLKFAQFLRRFIWRMK